jgi:Cu(I)/Ag(I) efflux system protein CusF
MKRVAILLFAALVTVPAFAQMKDMDMKSEKGKSQTHHASGTVTKAEKNKVTIKHGPVQSMNWPAMTMTFTVKDKAMLEKMKKDQKVDFEFVQQGKDYVVTGVK